MKTVAAQPLESTPVDPGEPRPLASNRDPGFRHWETKRAS